MAYHISDTEFSNFNGKPLKQSREDSIHPETTTSYEQDNATDETQIEEASKTEVLPSQQHKNQRETHEELYTTMELFHTKITLLNHIFTMLQEARNNTSSQQRLTRRREEKRICFTCKKTGHITRNCRTCKGFFKQNWQNVHSQSFDTQHTFNPNLTSSPLNRRYPVSASATSHHNIQKQRLNKEQRASSQTTSRLPHQPNITSPEFQNNGSNPLQDFSWNKTSKKRTKKEEIEYNTIQLHKASRQLSEVVPQICLKIYILSAYDYDDPLILPTLNRN